MTDFRALIFRDHLFLFNLNDYIYVQSPMLIFTTSSPPIPITKTNTGFRQHLKDLFPSISPLLLKGSIANNKYLAVQQSS